MNDSRRSLSVVDLDRHIDRLVSALRVALDDRRRLSSALDGGHDALDEELMRFAWGSGDRSQQRFERKIAAVR